MENWTGFFKEFSLNNADFIMRLSQSYPNLTQMEFKICCLLRAGQNNKEIAKMTEVTLRAVETARYRMRKKLPITTQENLTVFLMRI